MKYSEMTKFLNDNGIYVMQPVIANEVSAQLQVDISEEEFEEICASVYSDYLSCYQEPDVYSDYLSCYQDPDIWYLVDEELINRGYK